MIMGLPFKRIWCIDFEFIARDGETPVPVCMVAKEIGTGRVIKLWQDQLGPVPPFEIDDDTLFIAYVASAEVGCFLALGWPVPTRVLDLYVEFRRETNALAVAEGRSLLGALSRHHIPGITKEEKKAGRDLVMRGGPWTDSERRHILDYCETDIERLPALLEKMLPGIAPTAQAMGQALLRGRYTVAVARMERTGVPIDTEMLSTIRVGWNGIKGDLIKEVDTAYNVYENGSFKSGMFAKYLADQGIPWPKTVTGKLQLDRDTFRDQSKLYPQLAPLHELRTSLAELRVEKLAVGSDGRNHTSLWAFSANTGRNQPGSTKFVFGPAVWIRGLIKPAPGMALAYIDWSSQEVAIAAALSGDQNLIDAMVSGDPYLTFAKQAGLAPPDATKKSHPEAREACKQCVLGVNYGMGARTLAYRIDASTIEAESLLRQMARTYPVFTEWQSKSVDAAFLRGHMSTGLGWQIHITGLTKPTALKNFPMQAHGAEMLRLACCLATEDGIAVCAPVHDALLVEAPIAELDDVVARTQAHMASAARMVLPRPVPIKTDVVTTIYPERYMDEKRGRVMWDRVNSLLTSRAS